MGNSTPYLIPYGKQLIDADDIDMVVSVLKSDYLTTGPWVENFENELCRLTGAKYAIVCSNGTTALHIASRALGASIGTIGWTSPNTFLASANCIEFCGGHTNFIDIDKTLCIDPDLIEQTIQKSSSPNIIIPVDFAGVPADLPRIWKIAKKHGIKVIEDAAHSLGSTYTFEGNVFNCGSCNHSDAAILSFHPVKTVTTGEGGAVLTNDESIAHSARLLRSHGMTKDQNILEKNDGSWYYEMVMLANNYRITDFQCALGISQLKKLNAFKLKRQEIVKKYNSVFCNIDRLVTPPWPSNMDPCYHLYSIQFIDGKETRRKAYEYLKLKNILTQVHYIPVHTQPYYRNKYGFFEGMCPNAEKYYQSCLSLPLFPALSDQDVDYIIDCISSFFQDG